jgi:hypothetical protein
MTRSRAWLVVGPTWHFALLRDHYDDTLWGVGLLGEVLFAAVAVGLAFLAARLTSRG